MDKSSSLVCVPIVLGRVAARVAARGVYVGEDDDAVALLAAVGPLALVHSHANKQFRQLVGVRGIYHVVVFVVGVHPVSKEAAADDDNDE